jgi:Ca-activated chloride channel family protein
MKKRATILMLSGLAVAALADNLEVDSAYFHPAASLYIQGNMAGASNLLARGLAEFPDDGKLKRLKELLENQQQDQEQQNQDQQQNDQQQDQEQQDQQQNEQDQEQQDQNDPQQDPADQQEQQQPPEPQRAEQMSQDEAERLLDAMKQEEKNKRLELHPVMGRPVKVDKDW